MKNAVIFDTELLNENCIPRILNELGNNIDIIFTSNKPKEKREEVINFIKKKCLVLHIQKYLVYTLNNNQSVLEFKREVYENVKNEYDVKIVFERDKDAFDMWTEQGLFCLLSNK